MKTVTSPRRHRPLVTALLLALLASPVAAAADNDVDKVNGSITAAAGQTYGDLSTVNGSVKAGDDVQVDDMTTVNGSVRVGTKARIGGHVETVNGSIFIDRDGRVGKGIETVNGGIGVVATEIMEGIETVNGDVTVGIGSHVHGGIKVTKPSSSWMPINVGTKRKPRIVIGPDAVVDGPLVFEREVTLYVHKTARIGAVTGATAVAYDGARAPSD